MIVLGGLTFSEIRDANAVLEELGARDRVVLGGTRLCTGQDVAEALFFADDEASDPPSRGICKLVCLCSSPQWLL